MVQGLIGCGGVVLLVFAGWMIFILLRNQGRLVDANIKLCLDKGLHIIVTDPTGVTQTIRVQDRVAEVEQTIREMQEPGMTRSVEQWVEPDQQLPRMQEEEVRDITRGDK